MENKILEIIESQCGTDMVRQDLNLDLFESGLIDSLGFTELIIALEDEFDVQIPPTEMQRDEINTPAKIISHMLEKVKQA